MKKSNHFKLWLAGALLIPAFLLWKISATYFFTPVVSAATSSWINMHYSKLAPQLNYSEASRAWEIQTNLFQAAKPWTHNTYSPNLDVSGFTFISLGHISAATLGLPLFWALIMVYSSRRLKSGLIGTAVILIFSCITIIVHAEISIIETLNGSQQLRTFQDAYILIPHKPSPEWLWLLTPLKSVSSAFTLLVMPILLCYYFNVKEKE